MGFVNLYLIKWVFSSTVNSRFYAVSKRQFRVLNLSAVFFSVDVFIPSVPKAVNRSRIFFRNNFWFCSKKHFGANKSEYTRFL